MPRLALAAAGLALLLAPALPAAAAEPFVRMAGPPAAAFARVVAPVDGAELTAGEFAWLEWEPGAGLSALPGAEEWEAFLSLDGGATFPVRLTPHLSLDRKRVAVWLPATPSDDARLLLRFGDERREVEQPIAARLKIVAPPGIEVGPPRHWAFTRGEAARPGEAGVTLWAEGARDGSGWMEVESVETESSLAPAARAGAGLWWLAGGPRREPLGGVSEPTATGDELFVAAHAPRPPPPPTRSIPILSLTQRLNQ